MGHRPGKTMPRPPLSGASEALKHSRPMQIFSNVPLPSTVRGAAVALGNFDGVHRGHQEVIETAARKALPQGLPLGVLTFEPHPRQLFQPHAAPFRLTPWPAKARRLEGYGVDFTLVLPFDWDFARLTAEDFIYKVLLEGMGVKEVVVGYDFAFGHDRRGNAGYLSDLLTPHGIGVTRVDAVSGADWEIHSSTRVRDFLKTGHPNLAADVLGGPWEIESQVIQGDQRGRQLGFPTANMLLGEYLMPAPGVYAVRARVPVTPGNPAEAGEHPTENGTAKEEGTGRLWRWIDGVANIGTRPTFEGTEPRLEVHLFGYAGMLYGSTIRVALEAFLRPERRFPGIEALKQQIEQDCQAARDFLKTEFKETPPHGGGNQD